MGNEKGKRKGRLYMRMDQVLIDDLKKIADAENRDVTNLVTTVCLNFRDEMREDPKYKSILSSDDSNKRDF